MAADGLGASSAPGPPPENTAGTLGDENKGSSQQLESVTQMHAAAVNGDKANLARMIDVNANDLNTGDQFGRTPLMFCVLADRMECAELLLKSGAHVNDKDKGGRIALHWAAHKGNFRMLKLLLSKGADCREKDSEGQTAVHLCTRHKSPKCMALLLKQISLGEIDDLDKNKRSALHWAASYGNFDHVKMLIKQGSNIGMPDVEGKTPLHWAASSRDAAAVNCVKFVLDTTASVINWQDFEGRTALHLAVADGNEAIVNVLLSFQTDVEKCNVSALDNMFRTPLHWAAVLGHSKIVGLLLDKGADYASSDTNGATPLHYAAQNNYDDTVEVFLSHKNVTDEPDIDGRTAFVWAAGKGADDVIEVWMKHGVDIQQVDKTGGTALHAAVLSGHASTVRLLLEHGSQIDAADLQKHTPLFRACEMGHMDVVQTLADCGARVDLLDQDGRSPLHWAALGGHALICQTLMSYGIDPNFCDHTGRTPLQCAAYGGYVNCMSVLLEHEVNPNAQDSEGMTALHWVCSKGHLDGVKLLLEYHAFPNNMEFTEERYTPLDYALMGDHHNVTTYMIVQGALSITGIEDIAAQKIQSAFRGYRVRRTFTERKLLLMKHEHLKREAAKKRAVVDSRRKCETPVKSNMDESSDITAKCRLDETPTWSDLETDMALSSPLLPSASPRKKEHIPTEEEEILAEQDAKRNTSRNERERRKQIVEKQDAARVIQRSWKRCKQRQEDQRMKSRPEQIHDLYLRGTMEDWERQVAALTIQLAWRKYYRKKLLRSISPNKRRLLIWDPKHIAARQQALIESIYSEQEDALFWHPTLKPITRPSWLRCMPSPAVVSYNFALDQYEADPYQRPSTPYHNKDGRPVSHSWSHHTKDGDVTDNLEHVKLDENRKTNKFSYNMRPS